MTHVQSAKDATGAPPAQEEPVNWRQLPAPQIENSSLDFDLASILTTSGAVAAAKKLLSYYVARVCELRRTIDKAVALGCVSVHERDDALALIEDEGPIVQPVMDELVVQVGRALEDIRRLEAKVDGADLALEQRIKKLEDQQATLMVRVESRIAIERRIAALEEAVEAKKKPAGTMCKCGHGTHRHGSGVAPETTACAVNACGCDEFEPSRRPERRRKAVRS